MDANKVDQFLLINSSKFPPEAIPSLRERLLKLDDSKSGILMAYPGKDPTIALILSLLLGGLGIDRFYIGDTGLGLGKLLTGGGCGIWAIVDWFLIMNATRRKNFEALIPYL